MYFALGFSECSKPFLPGSFILFAKSLASFISSKLIRITLCKPAMDICKHAVNAVSFFVHTS